MQKQQQFDSSKKFSSHAHEGVTGIVESAIELSEKEKLAAAVYAKKLVGSDVSLSFRVNSTILGGVRIAIGDWLIDASLRFQLEQLVSGLKK